MPPPLRIGLCGGLVVEQGGRRIEAELAGRQGREVFAYLVLHRGRAVSRDELTALLWPERPPRMPEAALNTVLARLRRVLGHEVLPTHAQPALELPHGSWIDVEAAEDAAARAELLLAEAKGDEALELASVAAHLVAAPLLPGMQHPWVDQRRSEVSDICLRLLATTVRCGLALGGTPLEDAERAAVRMVEREPFRESGYRLLMDVHAARGDVVQALLVYEKLRALLMEELGIPPSPRIVARHEELLREGSPEQPRAHPRPTRDGHAPPAPPAGANVEIRLADGLARGAAARLVGRDAELERMRHRWAELAPDNRGPIAVCGEPGIGKTALTAAFAREVFESGGLVLYGQAQEDAVVPYAPLVEALRAFVSSTVDLASDEALQIHLGELGWLLPELAVHRSEPRATAGDPRLDRVRLYKAVAALLGRVASERPVLLVLEDMQWADADTDALLRQLLREGADQPILPLVTYQDVEVSAAHPLAKMLGDLRRDLGLTRITLSGLADEAIAELLGEDGADPELVRRLREHTSGNPFFVEELIRREHALGAEFALPDGVHEAIQDRLSRLEASTREALTTASVLGQRFNPEVLEETAGDERVGLALDGAVQAGWIVEEESGPHYRFRHRLAREAIYSSIGQGLRTSLHVRAARALERRGETADVEPAEIAHHYIASDRSDVAAEAISFSCEAAERARTTHAYEDATEHLRRAIDVLDRHRPGDVASRCALLLSLGEVGWQLGGPRAREIFEQAMRVARHSPESRHFVEATLGLGGRFYAPTGPDGPYIELLEEALACAAGDAELEVRVQARLAEHLIFVEPRRAEQLSDAALRLARVSGDAGLLASTLLARHATLLGARHCEQRLALADEQLGLAAAAGETELEALGNHWLLYDLCELGELDRARRSAARQHALADALGQPLYRHSALVWQRMLELLGGDLDRASQLAAEALNLAHGAHGEESRTHFVAQQLALVPFTGASERLAGSVRQRAAGGDPVWVAAAAFLAVHAGDRDRAGRQLGALSEDVLAGLRHDVFWLTTLALTAEAAVWLEDRNRAALLYKLLEPHADRYVQWTFNAPFGSVHGPLGLLAGALGSRGASAEHFEAAAQRHAAIGATLFEARSARDYAAGESVRVG